MPSTTTTAAATASNTTKCHKHNITAQHLSNVGHCGTLPKQKCSKHPCDQAAPRKPIDSCLKKPSNSDLKVVKVAAETHLLTCQKNQIGGSPSVVSPTSSTGPLRAGKCDHCGHVKCNSKADSDCGGVSSSASSASSCNLPPGASRKSFELFDVTTNKRCTCDGKSVAAKSPVFSSRLVQTKKKILKTSSSSAMFSRSSSMHDARSVSSSLESSIGGGGGGYEDQIEMKRIRDRIAQADVFLEAIGNASTITNYNSSRYVS